MKAFKVVYRHGHFIDMESKLRLIPVQGAEYTISAEDKAFITEDPKLEMADALSQKAKAEWALKVFGKDNFGKIANTGDQFFFRIGNSKKVQGDENREYIFICSLLEDLYLYRLKGKTGELPEDWRLADCICELDKCLLGGLTLSEKVPAKSLNSIFSNTVQFYFSMQRSGSANAFNTFYLYKPGMEITYVGATYQFYYGLRNMRKEYVDSRN